MELNFSTRAHTRKGSAPPPPLRSNCGYTCSLPLSIVKYIYIYIYLSRGKF